MRRAINCVYCPPKSSTTTPPSSAFILPPCSCAPVSSAASLAALSDMRPPFTPRQDRSEEHTSELQSRLHLVCRLLLEKKKNTHSLLSRYTSVLYQLSET